jgi:hypothetical protein
MNNNDELPPDTTRRQGSATQMSYTPLRQMGWPS